MAQNRQRRDPYKNFKFRVKWDGRYVAGISKVGALHRSMQVVERRDDGAGLSHKRPARTTFEPLTLERGVTHDVEFERWASMIGKVGSAVGAERSLHDFRKDILIEMYDDAKLVLAYRVYRCWVSEFRALPDRASDAVAIETLRVENEGWERV